MWDLYVFDSIEAATGSKMCCWIFVPALEPSLLQGSQWYFAYAYLWWSWSALQNFGLIAQNSTKWRPYSFEYFRDYLLNKGFYIYCCYWDGHQTNNKNLGFLINRKLQVRWPQQLLTWRLKQPGPRCTFIKVGSKFLQQDSAFPTKIIGLVVLACRPRWL